MPCPKMKGKGMPWKFNDRNKVLIALQLQINLSADGSN